MALFSVTKADVRANLRHMEGLSVARIPKDKLAEIERQLAGAMADLYCNALNGGELEAICRQVLGNDLAPFKRREEV